MYLTLFFRLFRLQFFLPHISSVSSGFYLPLTIVCHTCRVLKCNNFLVLAGSSEVLSSFNRARTVIYGLDYSNNASQLKVLCSCCSSVHFTFLTPTVHSPLLQPLCSPILELSHTATFQKKELSHTVYLLRCHLGPATTSGKTCLLQVINA